MENTKPTIQQQLFDGRYFYSFDILRVVCLILMIFTSFGLPLPLFALVRPFLNAATGILFTLYGFCVLRDGADLRKNIKHSAKVFLIMLAVYLPITIGYQRIMYGLPFMYFDKSGLFNSLVLNYWQSSPVSSIWYVQSVLYALVILWVLRRLKKLDWLLCTVLFVISILMGELAELTGIKFGAYNYIPGNFFTRTIPYMLLGRLIYRYFGKIRKLGPAIGIIAVIVGIILSAAEFFILLIIGKLGYKNHFAPFILIAFGACLMAIQNPNGGEKQLFGVYAKKMYKPIYFLYKPLGCLLTVPPFILCRTQAKYDTFRSLAGIAAAFICLGGSFLLARRYYKKQPRALSAEYKLMHEAESVNPFPAPDSNIGSGMAALKGEISDFELEQTDKPTEDKTSFEIDTPEKEADSFRFEVNLPVKNEDTFSYEVNIPEKKEDTFRYEVDARNDEDRSLTIAKIAMASTRRHKKSKSTGGSD